MRDGYLPMASCYPCWIISLDNVIRHVDPRMVVEGSDDSRGRKVSGHAAKDKRPQDFPFFALILSFLIS